MASGRDTTSGRSRSRTRRRRGDSPQTAAETTPDPAQGGEASTPTADPAQIAAEQILGANPIVGLDREEILDAIGRLLRLFAMRPDRLAREEIALLAEWGRVLAGNSTIEPDPKDRRFQHPVWKKNFFFRRLMQGFLAWRASLNQLIDRADASPEDKERARFALQLFTEAFAPTNSVIGNPSALMRIIETRGKSLLYGARNMLDDLLNNGGMPRQVDDSQFHVGKNLAASPGAVVYRGELFELIHYQPASEQVYARPLLIVPPQINKFYIVDLAPGRSFAEYLTRNGVQLFTISWRNPTAAQRHWQLETYLKACLEAVEVACDVSGSPGVNLLAACAGGFTAATLLGYMAAVDDRRVASLTLLVTVLDTECPTLMGLFASKSGVAAAIKRSRARGVLEGREMARVFAWLRPNDLIWSFVANNWVMGNKPPAFDVLYWNSDTTRLPAEFHADLLQIFFENPLLHPGKLKLLGQPIDMSKIALDVYVLAGVTDHITPWQACYETRRVLTGSDLTFVLSSSGHIQSIVNPPGNSKARYYLHADLALTADRWLAAAEERQGSWWEHWLDWYGGQGGARRPAPVALGSERYPPGDRAPGRYVHQR